ncbi:hypothetical protein ABPG74_000157 [Tetrahymena malaccensis]
MSEIEKLDQNLDNIVQGLDDADKMLQVLFDEQNIDKLAENISLGQYAELNNALAYHANSLYFMFLKTNGFPVKEHKINQELARVKTYMQKVKAGVEQKKIEEVYSKNPKQVNTDVLHRVIKSTESHNQRVLEQQAKEWQDNQDKMELESASIQNTQKPQKKLHRGALLPTGSHLNWKDQINEILK